MRRSGRACHEPGVFGYNTRFSVHSQRESQRAMLEVNPIRNTIKDLRERTEVLRGYL